VRRTFEAPGVEPVFPANDQRAIIVHRLATAPMRRSHSFEAAAKAKLAGSIETQPGDHFAALSAFRIVDVPINRKVINHQVSDWVITRLAVRHIRLTRRRSATAGGSAHGLQ